MLRQEKNQRSYLNPAKLCLDMSDIVYGESDPSPEETGQVAIMVALQSLEKHLKEVVERVCNIEKILRMPSQKHTFPILLLALLCIAGMLLFIIQWKTCTDNVQVDVTCLEKEDQSQTVIIILPCCGQLPISKFESKENAKMQQSEAS
ncbi:uncharacterized protein LOC134181353 [Corticium candelabrum]|uniref:uncharacterized protein LOC134181353 n=1 Tax=Corticium candelabrum TaxID=121492 RepID=UPI002E2620AA|nr:uncharacterized protein LOC134181353 [Corticium candelabrum]XP_062504603.1 uncharacterized protein LOC134181353 [Corticium candelabrum]XP_062504604.1 uncharacterized protein LOC134181353 [Corticium candelabrum]